MAERNPNVPGVLRGTAVYRCETQRHDRHEPVITKVNYVAQQFDANLWTDFKGKVDAYLDILGGRCKLDDITMEDQRASGKHDGEYSLQVSAQAYQECKAAFNPKPNPNEGWFSSILSACSRAFTRVGCAMQFSGNSTVASSDENRVRGDHPSNCHSTACYR